MHLYVCLLSGFLLGVSHSICLAWVLLLQIQHGGAGTCLFSQSTALQSCSPKNAALIKQTLVLAPCDIPPHYRRVDDVDVGSPIFLFKQFHFSTKRP